MTGAAAPVQVGLLECDHVGEQLRDIGGDYSDMFRGLLANATSRLVGVCFGHQAIAHALGGATARSNRGWGVGIHAADIVRTRRWMQPRREQLRLVMSHQDQVVAVPQNATVLARTQHCDVAMLEIGDRLLGIQGHPEYTTEYARALLETRLDRIPHELAVAARATFSDDTDAVPVSEWIARFLGQAESAI